MEKKTNVKENRHKICSWQHFAKCGDLWFASLNENKLSFSGNNKVYFDISNAEIYKYNYEKTIKNIVSPVCQPLSYHC